MSTKNPELELADQIAEFYADPLGFVLFAYPWGEKGSELERADGPDQWQIDFLNDIGREVRERGFDGLNAVKPMKFGVASGHGIGKSTVVAWVVNWIMSTRPNCIGTITANTFPQLETKTWAAIRTWSKRCITAHWFVITGDRMYHRDYKESWFCSAQTCREENSEAFAGQHAASSTSFYIFDEASSIADKIFEVAQGGLTDGEPMMYMFGNPTRNTGQFHKACFGSDRHLWNHRSIDSRTSARTNKGLIDEWIGTHGIDSDFVKVRVLGQPPNASELQFISRGIVNAAQQRQVSTLPDDPLVCGVDVSGGGSAWTVCRFRRGLDARSIPPIRIPGEVDRSVIIAKMAEVLSETGAMKVDAMFVDSAFGAAIVERLHTLGHRQAIEVNFGGPSPDSHQANKRAFMWSQCKEWLNRGAIDQRDEKLEIDLIGPGYHINKSNKLVIESKQDMQKRNEPSPDDADALVLTFAEKVSPKKKPKFDQQDIGGSGWML